MSNNKGFTLTEVLLAAMIVGIIGIALAALTTAALRESGIGRTRMMLRNQVSLFLRQLRQDTQAAAAYTLNGSREVIFTIRDISEITYSCCENNVSTCRRIVQKGESQTSEIILNHVQCSSGVSEGFIEEDFTGTEQSNVKSILGVKFVVGLDGKPPVKEAIDTTFVLPQGVVSNPNVPAS